MLPAPWTIGVRRWSKHPTLKDRQGNPLESWAAPVPMRVHGVAPTTSAAGDEPDTPNRSPVVESLSVYAPAGVDVRAQDRVVWPHPAGVEYSVEGIVEDWAKGPWLNPIAGVVIHLEVVEG